MKTPLALLLCTISFTLQADMFTPSHMCSKPYKPYSFNYEFEKEQFVREVEEYQACLRRFIEEQADAIENHKRAAEDAADEWDRYKRFELDLY